MLQESLEDSQQIAFIRGGIEPLGLDATPRPVLGREGRRDPPHEPQVRYGVPGLRAVGVLPEGGFGNAVLRPGGPLPSESSSGIATGCQAFPYVFCLPHS
jgi:hypothetical protein